VTVAWEGSRDGIQKSRTPIVNVRTEAEDTGEATADWEGSVGAVVTCSDLQVCVCLSNSAAICKR
jgi:hypothetical protein